MNFSFSGCGYLGIYHVGVSACLRKYVPNLVIDKISGTSSGALAAVSILCNCDLGLVTSLVIGTATESRRSLLGPLSPAYSIARLLKEGLQKVLPEDAHVIARGRLFISATRIRDRKNVLISDFDSREELIEALMCSTYIPFFSGFIPPNYRGAQYMDGGFTDNCPDIDEGTVTVCPFAGEGDIAPQRTTTGILMVNLVNTSLEVSGDNFYRLAHSLLPPHPGVLAAICRQGFADAKAFLLQRGLVTCVCCFSLSALGQRMRGEGETHFEAPSVLGAEVSGGTPPCPGCIQEQQDALRGGLPSFMEAPLQDATCISNVGVTNWILNRRPLRTAACLLFPLVFFFDLTRFLLFRWSRWLYRRCVEQAANIFQFLLKIMLFMYLLVVITLLGEGEAPPPNGIQLQGTDKTSKVFSSIFLNITSEVKKVSSSLKRIVTKVRNVATSQFTSARLLKAKIPSDYTSFAGNTASLSNGGSQKQFDNESSCQSASLVKRCDRLDEEFEKFYVRTKVEAIIRGLAGSHLKFLKSSYISVVDGKLATSSNGNFSFGSPDCFQIKIGNEELSYQYLLKGNKLGYAGVHGCHENIME